MWLVRCALRCIFLALLHCNRYSRGCFISLPPSHSPPPLPPLTPHHTTPPPTTNITPSQVADRILVFHRGVGKAQIKGLLIEEKLDLLTEYLVLNPLDSLLSMLPFRGNKGKKKAGSGLETATTSAGEEFLLVDESVARSFARMGSAAGGEVTGGKYIASNHKYAVVRILTGMVAVVGLCV